MTDPTLRYAAAACQVDFPNPADRSGIKTHTDRMLTMITQVVEGYAPFLPVKLVVWTRTTGPSVRLKTMRLSPGRPPSTRETLAK